MVAHDPLHGSGRAVFPHPALALGSDASTAHRCCLPYPLQRTGRAGPALSPGRVLLVRVPLGQSPSLHRLRPRLPGLVRRLHRYYETVRLPGLVHRRRASLDFPTRPAALSATGEPRTSRFSCEVFPYVPGSSTARDPNASRASDAPSSAFRPFLQCRRPEGCCFRGSIARPARTPVNASALPLRETPHDSGPLWVASPSTCDSFIHYTPPVYPGAFRNPSDARTPNRRLVFEQQLSGAGQSSRWSA
jgi:hypothetical protein